MDFEVTIIGAGVICLSIAKALSEKRINTVVIEKSEIQPDYSGIRKTSITNDFITQSRENHKINGLINFFGINSPCLTSSLAISKYMYTNIVKKRIIK